MTVEHQTRTRQVYHPGKKVVMNKFRSVSEVSHSATAHCMLRMSHAENPPNPDVPLSSHAPHFLTSESHP